MSQDSAHGTFYEGAMSEWGGVEGGAPPVLRTTDVCSSHQHTHACTPAASGLATDTTNAKDQANIVAAGYGK